MATAGYAQRLKRARAHAKISQPELARRVGIKQQSIQYLENPKRSATGSRYTGAIARELGVDATWLATGKGEMLPAAMEAREESAGYEVLPKAAREIAIAWAKLSPGMQEVFRELIFVHAFIEKKYPWLRRGKPKSTEYDDWERHQEQNMEAMIQLAADRTIRAKS